MEDLMKEKIVQSWKIKLATTTGKEERMEKNYIEQWAWVNR